MLDLGDDFVANALSFEHALAETTMKNDQSREYPSYYTNTTLDALCTAKGLAALRSLDAKELNYAEADRNFALDDAQAAAASAFLEQMCELFDFRAVLKVRTRKRRTMRCVLLLCCCGVVIVWCCGAVVLLLCGDAVVVVWRCSERERERERE